MSPALSQALPLSSHPIHIEPCCIRVFPSPPLPSYTHRALLYEGLPLPLFPSHTHRALLYVGLPLPSLPLLYTKSLAVCGSSPPLSSHPIRIEPCCMRVFRSPLFPPYTHRALLYKGLPLPSLPLLYTKSLAVCGSSPPLSSHPIRIEPCCMRVFRSPLFPPYTHRALLYKGLPLPSLPLLYTKSLAV